MSDDLDWIGQPSDEVLAAAIRRARGLPPDAPVAVNVIREVRFWSAREARRWVRARRLRLPVPVPTAPASADAAVREVISDVLSGPEVACLLYLLASLPDVAAALGEGVGVALAASPRHAAAPARNYAAAKVGVPAWPSRWGTAGMRAFVGGRLVPCRSPADLGPHPLHVAGVNASSPAVVAAWVERLDLSDAARSNALNEIQAVGTAACAGLPLTLWQLEPGPPRGVWPPPPVDGGDDGSPPPPAPPGGGAR